jgi:hypothetical protein
LDTSGNFLLGKTASDRTVAGGEILSSGGGRFTRDSATPLYLNRLTNDGALIDIRRNDTVAGEIGVVNGNNPYIANNADNSGLQFGSGTIAPFYDSAAQDNSVDLGSSSTRFKDLYLSGGIYLGGTGAANKLDDYEEGTWTPTLTTSGTDFSSVVYVAREGNYTKVGNLVYISCRLYTSSVTVGSASGSVIVTGLPFTPAVQQSMPLNDMRLWTTNPSSAGTADGATEVYLFKRSSSSGAESQLAVSDVRTTNPSNLCQFSGCYIIA